MTLERCVCCLGIWYMQCTVNQVSKIYRFTLHSNSKSLNNALNGAHLIGYVVIFVIFSESVRFMQTC